jgi:hypothetical protein
LTGEEFEREQASIVLGGVVAAHPMIAAVAVLPIARQKPAAHAAA